MTVEEYRNKYRGQTPAQVRRLASESPEFRAETEMLYRKVSGASMNKNCQECWVDAYAVVIKSDPAEAEKRAKRKFDLKAGALLIDRKTGDNSKMCSMHNITDELALYHLRINPGCIRFFSRYPENWQELVAESVRKPKPQSRSGGKKSESKKPASKKPVSKQPEDKQETETGNPAES